MKQHKDTIRFITKIEKEFDINSIKYKGIKIWPVLRLFLASNFSSQKYSNPPKINDIKNLKIRFKEYEYTFTKSLKNISSSNNIEILLIHNEKENNQIKLNNHDYSLYTDSFYNLVEKKHTVKILSFKDKTKNYSNEKERINIDFISDVIRTKTLLIYSKNKVVINNIEKLVCYLIKNHIRFNYDHFLYLFSFVLANHIYMLKILKKLSPKSIFLTCFYKFDTFGLILAAQKLNIPTIDVQHGIQNDYHAMYTNWKRIPKKGYIFLPEYFWVWNSISKKRIKNWTNKTTYHKSFIGGHPFYLTNDYLSVKNDIAKKLFPRDKIHILVSLQTKEYYDTNITDAINKSNDNIMWHFKAHPVHDKDLFLNDIKPYITNLNKVEYSSTNNLTIQEIAKYIDINITAFSTVAFELRDVYKVPTIFTEKINHANNISGFYFNKDSNTLLKQINNILSNFNNIKKEIRSKYILENTNFKKHIKKILK